MALCPASWARDKINAEFTFVDQDITPRTADLPRGRRMYGGRVTYQLFRFASAYARKFQNTRGIDLSAGALQDVEDYPFTGGRTDVTRRDCFAAATIRALHGFDLNIQPTRFTSSVSPGGSQHNSQYETAGYALYRIVDEETAGLPTESHGPRLAFLHVAIPFHHDLACRGPTAFENYRVGAERSAKWFTTARRGVTFLGSVRYDFQDFYHLGRRMSLVGGSFTVGF